MRTSLLDFRVKLLRLRDTTPVIISTTERFHSVLEVGAKPETTATSMPVDNCC